MDSTQCSADIIKLIDLSLGWIELGGPGSGHHGHKGIKGQRGGSVPSSVGKLAGLKERAGKLGVEFVTTPDNIANFMADAYEQKWGWDREHTREGFVVNQTQLLKNATQPSEEFQASVMEGVLGEVESGRAGKLPVVIRGMREGYNDAWVEGVHEGTHIEFVYNPKRAIPEKQPLGGQISSVSLTYPNTFGGTYTHEWGHHVTENPKIQRRAAAIIDDKKETIKKSVSRYAIQNPSELAAECYALSVHPNYSSVSKEGKSIVDYVLQGTLVD